MSTPGIEVRPITDMTTNRHFCEVFFTDVRVPVANLVGVEGNAFKQTMRQLEHERGGDRPAGVEPRAVPARRRTGRHGRSAGPPGDRRPRDGVPDRPHPRRPGGPRSGPGGVLGGDEVLLHRARVAGRRVRRRRARPGGDAVDRRHPRPRLRPRLHDHGRHVEHHAQHPRRAGPRPAPRSRAEHDGRRQPVQVPLRPRRTAGPDDRRRRGVLAVHRRRPADPRRRRRGDRRQHRPRPPRGRRRRPRGPRRRRLRRPDLADAAPGAAPRPARRALAARRDGQRVLHERRQRVGRLGAAPRPGRPPRRGPARALEGRSGATRATTASPSGRWPRAATAPGGPATSRCCSTSRRCRGTTPTRWSRRSSGRTRTTIAGVPVRADHRRRRRLPDGARRVLARPSRRSAGATTSCSSPTR